MPEKPQQHKSLDKNYPLSRADIKLLLQQNGVSVTRQRLEIGEYVFQQAQHLSADDIIQGLASTGKQVARATVYNTMGLFASKGVVTEILIDRERVFYDSNTNNHQHLYHINRGELIDIDNVAIDMPVLAGDLEVVATNVVIKVSTKNKSSINKL